ncbi:MAG: alpha/beta hydrolase [Pseudomonadota bacterium]
MQPRRHSLLVPNTIGEPGMHELVFYDWGDINSQRVAVCVHGLTRNAHDFDALAQALVAKGRRVFTLNMAGRGESAWLADPAGYNYASYVADCNAVMDNFHLRGVEWIGTSMGGLIGMMIASQSNSRIRRLIMNDIGAFLSKEALTRIYEYVRTMPSRFADRGEADRYLRAAFAPFNITDPALWEQFVDSSLITGPDGALRYACDPAIATPLRAATEDFTKIDDINLTPIWNEVNVPTYVIHGAESDILTTPTLHAMRATNQNMQTITIPGVGHAPPLMSAEQIRIVTDWLDGTTASLMAASF